MILAYDFLIEVESSLSCCDRLYLVAMTNYYSSTERGDSTVMYLVSSDSVFCCRYF